MITELFFIRNFTSFWSDLLPGSERYVRLLNSGIERFDLPVDSKDPPNRRAMINTVAYLLFDEVVNTKKTLSHILQSVDKQLGGFHKKALISLGHLSSLEEYQDPLGAVEVRTATGICQIMISRFSSSKRLVLSPVFPGCGFLNECEGDLLVGDTLFELKAGDRNFSIVDVRQLLVYAALNYIAGNKYEIHQMGLVNPRRCVEWKADLRVVADDLASSTPEELFHEIISFLTRPFGST